jgi:hypothetical protein
MELQGGVNDGAVAPRVPWDLLSRVWLNATAPGHLVGAEASSPVSNNLTGRFCFKLTHGAPTLSCAKFSRHLGRLDNSWWAV